MATARKAIPGTVCHSEAVGSFTYLGSTLSRAVKLEVEIISWIAKASSVFGRLRKNIWQRRGISFTTKLKVYRAVVVTNLSYACETWTVYSRHARQLNHFNMNCLCKLLKIGWQDMVPDSNILTQASVPSVRTLFQF